MAIAGRRLFSILRSLRPPRCLGVLLCYNDDDMLADSIEHLLSNSHHVIAWDHGSDDNTPAVLDRYQKHFLERRYISREFDFYKLYPAMSEHLIKTYVSSYDWISWPDTDEILEGPDRRRSYFEAIKAVLESPYDWVQFRNFNFWFTDDDDAREISPVKRIRRYSLFPDCAPRIRAWRSAATNERVFNHNPPLGLQYPRLFNLKHYPIRTEAQMERRVQKDRANLQRDGANYHYANMQRHPDRLRLAASQLHRDDGCGELDQKPIYNWRDIYGYGPQKTEPSQ
jgi:hypothetical protein